MADDGKLSFSTAMDTSAFEKGVDKIESVLNQLLSELKKLSDTIKGVPPIELEADTSELEAAETEVSKLSELVDEVPTAEIRAGPEEETAEKNGEIPVTVDTEQAEKAVEDLKKGIESIPEPEINTTAATSEIDALEQKIEVLKKAVEMLSVTDSSLINESGEYVSANAAMKDFKRLEKLDAVKAKLEELEIKKKELEKSVTVDIDVESDTKPITDTKDAINDVGKKAKKTSEEASKAFKSASKNAGTAVNNSCSDILKTLSATLGKVKGIAAAAGLAFGVREIVVFGKEAVESAANVKAANSQLEQTFGSLQTNAESAIKSVADASGILETRLNSTATGIYAFAKTSGMESEQALSMMQDALQVAADSAAYYDRSLEETSETLKSFLKGNYANDAALGLSATEYTRNAAAMKLYGQKFQELSEAQKQLTLLQMVKDANALSGAEGQAAREAEGWENVLGNLREAWRQLLAVVGQPALELATGVVQRLTEALTYLTEKARIAVAALSQLFGWEMKDTASVAENIGQSVTNQEQLTEEVKETEKAEKGSLAAFDQLNTISSKTEDSDDKNGTAPAVLPAVTAAQTIPVSVELDTTKADITGFVERVRDTFDSLKTWLSDNFSPTFEGIWDGLVSESVELYGTLQHIFEDIKTLGEPLAEYFNGEFLTYLQTAFAVAGEVVLGLFDTFNMVFADIWDLAVFPILSDFITVGLPLITEFQTEAVRTFGAWFEEIKSIFDMLWQDAARPVLTFISEIWHDLMQSLKKFWDKWGAPIFEKFRTAIHTAGELFTKLWNDIFKPIFDKYMAKLDELWREHMKPLVDNLLDFVGEFINAAIDIYNGFIAPLISWFADKFGPVIVGVMGVAIDAVGSAVGNIIDALSGIIDYLKGVVNFVAGVFTGDWDRAWNGVKTAFEGIWGAFADIVKAPLNLILGMINGFLECLEYGINSTIWNLNNIKVDAPDWVEELTGISSFGLNLDTINLPEIPYLAQGTVVPANYGNFLAVLGDNKREAEVVSPLSTIKKAVMEANAESGGASPKEIVIYTYLYPNSAAYHREVVKIIDDDRRNRGE